MSVILVGTRIRLKLEVCDTESGLYFPAGSEGKVSFILDDKNCVECEFDTSLADPLDSGNISWPLVEVNKLEILE